MVLIAFSFCLTFCRIILDFFFSSPFVRFFPPHNVCTCGSAVSGALSNAGAMNRGGVRGGVCWLVKPLWFERAATRQVQSLPLRLGEAGVLVRRGGDAQDQSAVRHGANRDECSVTRLVAGNRHGAV